MESIDELIRMVSAEGWMEVFWSRIARDRSTGGKLTYRRCYELMEAEFQDRYGTRRFRSYDAFRKTRDRKNMGGK